MLGSNESLVPMELQTGNSQRMLGYSHREVPRADVISRVARSVPAFYVIKSTAPGDYHVARTGSSQIQAGKAFLSLLEVYYLHKSKLNGSK
ncbi:MAG: hypothetical protein KAR65_01235 [Anaerolineales bacterium]|nr:hypothetical protein [Anaerolineales bacterium]